MNKIKEFRLEKGLSVEKLAEAVNINMRTIFRWEAGTTEITSNNLVALANFFGCTTDELLGRDVAEPAPSNSIKITPLARRLLDAFYQIEEVDQNKLVAMAEALAVMS